MHIVIELDDKTYKDIKEENSIYGINDGLSVRITGKVVGAIQSGTPLPKGHGRLIDEEKISLSGIHFETELDHAMMIGRLNSAPTIIEADKEQTDDNT